MSFTSDDLPTGVDVPRTPHALDVITWVIVGVPFVFSMRNTESSSWSSTSVDAKTGHAVTTKASWSRSTDSVAAVCGGVGLVLALATLVLWKRTAPEKKGLRIGLTLAAVAVALVHVLWRSGLAQGLAGGG